MGISVTAKCRTRDEFPQRTGSRIGRLSEATSLRTPGYGRWVFLCVLTSLRSEFFLIWPFGTVSSRKFEPVTYSW